MQKFSSHSRFFLPTLVLLPLIALALLYIFKLVNMETAGTLAIFLELGVLFYVTSKEDN